MRKETTKKQPLNTGLAVLPISTIASALNVHQRTLRIYDREGILSPVRSQKNRRNYSLNDLEKAKLILNNMLKQNFAKIWYEYHYKYIKPLIFAEEYLDDSKHKNPLDYKTCKDNKYYL